MEFIEEWKVVTYLKPGLEIWRNLVFPVFICDNCVPLVWEKSGSQLFVITVEKELDFDSVLFIDIVLVLILVIIVEMLVLVGRARQNFIHLLL